MNGQDWTPVKFGGNKEQKAAKQAAVARSITSHTVNLPTGADGKPAWKLEKEIDDGGAPKKITPEDKQRIIELRNKAKLTREQLAKQLNMQKQVIDEIETGKAIENKQQIGKIVRHLERLIPK
jgi:ribosome-binding protein aMBF1 (putative translation factor)